MKVLKIIFIGIFVLIVIVFVGGFIFLKNLDVSKYKPQIISQATTALARPFDLKDIQLQVSLKEGIRLNLKGVTIGDDPAFQSGDFFKVSDVFVGVDVMALLKGTIAVSKVQVQAPQIVIIKTADGRLNAETIGKKPDAAPATGQPADSAVPAESQEASSNKPMVLPTVLVDSINVDSVTIQYIDRSFQPELNVTMDQLDLKVSQFSLDRPFSFEVSGRAFSTEKNYKVTGKAQLDVAKNEVKGSGISITTDLGKLALDKIRALPMLKDVPFPDLLAGKFNVTVKDLAAGPAGLGDITADVQFTDGAVQMKVAEGMSFNASAIGLNINGLSLVNPFKFSFQAAYLSNVPNIKVDGQAQLDMAQQLVKLQNTKISTSLESFDMKSLRAMPALKDASLPESMRGQFNVVISEMTAGAAGLVSLVSQGELLQGSAQLKELAVPVEPIRLKFTSTTTQINLEDFFIGIGKASIKAGAQVDDYAGKQVFSADLDVQGINLKEILPQEKAEVKVEGLMSGQMTVQGQGFKPENMDLVTGDGSLEIKDGKLVDLNILKMALSQIPLLSNFADALADLLPEPYRTKLNKKDTVFGSLDMKIAIKDGLILVDPLNVDAEEFQFLGKTEAKFDQTYSTEGSILISPEMSEKIVEASEQLEFLMSPEERKIVLPFKVSGKGGTHPSLLPDPGYISKKLIQQKGASEVQKALNKVFGQDEEAAPAGGKETAPQQQKAPEEEIIKDIFDSIFK